MRTFFRVSGTLGDTGFTVYPPALRSSLTLFLVEPFQIYQGSGGNRLLTTDHIVDMGIPRPPADAQMGRSTDSRGRKIKWDD